MDTWFQETRDDLMLNLPNLNNPEHRRFIMEDWQNGRDKLSNTLRQKLTFIDRIPFKLTGIAHPQPDVARDMARKCLQQFASGGPTAASDEPVHHRLSVKFLAPESPLHAQLLRFLGGDSMKDDLPDLWKETVPFKFVKMIEQSIERCHAIGKMNIRRAPRHKEAFWSLGLRQLCLQRHVQRTSGFMEELGKYCGDMKCPRIMAEEFRPLMDKKWQ